MLGILAGAAAVVPVFYLLMGPDVSRLGSASLPMPAAQVWKAIAELVATGFSALHPSARWAMLIGGALGLAMEWASGRTRGKFPLSAVGIGLATTIQFPVAFSMALGALLFWGLGVRFRLPASPGHRVFVEERETLCAGIIAGGSLVGVTITLLETLVLR